MSSVNDFLDLMPATVTYRSALTRDAYGKVVTYTPLVSYRARVNYRTTQRVSRISGEDVLTNTEVWIAGLPDLHVGDEITLPNGKKPILEDWDQVPDEKGPFYTKLFMR